MRRIGTLRKPFDVRCAHSGIVIIAADRVFKTAFANSYKVQLEVTKYRNAIARWPVLRDILAPLQSYQTPVASCLMMDRYAPLSFEHALPYAVDLFQTMQLCKAARSDFVPLATAPQMQAGIKSLERLYGASIGDVLTARLAHFGVTGHYAVGFAHGDFHSRNIMLTASGDPKLIDLDCMRVDGIQELDALSFVLEAEWSRSGRPWFEQMPEFLTNELRSETRSALEAFNITFTADLAAVYLVERVGQEALNYGFEYLPHHLAKAADVLQRSMT